MHESPHTSVFPRLAVCFVVIIISVYKRRYRALDISDCAPEPGKRNDGLENPASHSSRTLTRAIRGLMCFEWPSKTRGRVHCSRTRYRAVVSRCLIMSGDFLLFVRVTAAQNVRKRNYSKVLFTPSRRRFPAVFRRKISVFDSTREIPNCDASGSR